VEELVRTIPFFNYPALFEENMDQYLDIIKDVLVRGAYIMQRDLADFEQSLATYLGVRHAIGTADGTLALLMSLKAAGIGAGDEVIVPSHSFVASAAAVHHTGANARLADCGPDHLIDPKSVDQLITPKTRAIMPVQLNGRVADMEAICQIAERNELLIVEDSCQALGAKFHNRFAGTFGIAGAFSFYPSKTLGCFGDGGAVVTNDDTVAEKIRLLRDHGRGNDGKINCFGFNARLDNLQAAVLNLKLKNYDRTILKRREIATQYHKKLSGIKELLLPPPPDADREHFDIFQNYEIEAKRRGALRVHLNDNGIQTILQWGGYAVHQFENLGFDEIPSYTEKMTKRFMLLPMNCSLTKDDVDYISEKIIEFYK
jgi:dTDP-4-amino-4,6-dideoxygalactose transaminase